MRTSLASSSLFMAAPLFHSLFRRVEVMRVDASGLMEEAAPATYDSELKGGSSWPWRQ